MPREVRRRQLLNAAVAMFSNKGVRASSVDDIVQAAGVAKGTFYLYFASKDDVVTAVAERLVESVADRIEAAAGDRGRSPVDGIMALGNALATVGDQPFEREMVQIIHRPENRAVHERMTERVMVRLRPTLAGVIARGIAAGLFRPQDPRLAAAFVLGTLNQVHDVVDSAEQMADATAALHAFVLGGLGYVGPIQTDA